MNSGLSVSNSLEYAVKRQNRGKRLAALLTLVILDALFAIVLSLYYLLVCPPLIFLVLVIAGLAAYGIWFFFSEEIEVSLFAGEISITRIFGKKRRKKGLTVPIRSFVEISPCSSEAMDKYSAAKFEKIYDFRGTPDAPDACFGVFVRERSGKKAVVFLEVPQRVIPVLRFYNAPALSGLR